MLFLCLIGSYAVPCAQAAAQADVAQSMGARVAQAEAQARQGWQATLAQADTPATGCFHAKYPSMIWESVPCSLATHRVHPMPSARKSNARTIAQGAGLSSALSDAPSGKVYALKGHGLISRAVGSFPAATGITSVNSDAHPDAYSLQLNSNNATATATCNNHVGCKAWQQFLYGNDGPENAAYILIEYWMNGFGSSCPAGWISWGTDSCYIVSQGVSVPHYPITQLANFRLTAKAVANGNDSVVFANGSDAYSVSAKDNVLDIASVWTAADFNVDGSSSGAKAYFNTGTSVTTKLEVTDGTTAAPTCISEGSTSGETNNLIIGPCTVSGGAMPSIQFTGKI